MNAKPHQPTDFLPLTLDAIDFFIDDEARLSNIQCSIPATGITVIMGHNGAGKSLLLKLICGLLQPSRGVLRWKKNPEPPCITFVPQHAVLLNRSVTDNILLPLLNQGEKQKQSHQYNLERCHAALAWANITHLGNHSATRLSGGEKQLVALARAWALQPTILLLDEPSANLDPVRSQQVTQLIMQLSQDCKIILSSHHILHAREVANDILLMEYGKLVTHLSAELFFNSTAFHRYSGTI
jgi:tungstate transport system ATP-binding protein